MYLLSPLSVSLFLARDPRGGSAFLQMLPVGGKKLRGQTIAVMPPNALSVNVLKFFCPSAPHD